MAAPLKNVTVFIGNPGAGKSTLLNGLLQKISFKSGISLGSGLTTVCQWESDSDNNLYVDTPGLSDDTMREKAAKEISNALRKSGIFKIFFVITLESGRIKPDDKTTIRLVTESAPIGNQYSIIVNKVEPEVLELLDDNNNKRGFIAKLNDGLPGTSAIFFNQYRSELSAKANIVPELTTEIIEFISQAPALVIQPNEVKDIKPDQYTALKKQFEEQLAQLTKDNQLLQKKITDQIALYENMVTENNKKQEQMQKDFAAQMENNKKHYEKLIHDVKKKSEKGGWFGRVLGGVMTAGLSELFRRM